MHRALPIFHVLAAAMAVSVVFGGQSLTLDQAIDRAQRMHPGFKVRESEIEALEGNRATALALPNPSITVGPGLKHLTGDGASNSSFHGEFGFEQLIEFPGKRSLRAALADGDVRLRKIALEGFKQELRIEVRRVFFKALAAGQIAALRTEQVQSAQTFLKGARKRVEGGYASDFETVKAQSDLIAALKGLGDARGDVRSSKLKLSALMGMLPDTSFILEGKLDGSVFALPTGDPVAMALSHNSAIRIRALQVGISEKNIEAVKLGRRPDLTVSPSMEYSRDEQVYGLNLSLPLPIWDRGMGEIQRAAGERKASQAELDKVKQEISLSVQEAVETVLQAKEQLELYTPDFLESLRNIMQRAETVYGQSSTTLLIYLEARRNYFENLSDYHQVLGVWAQSHIDLEAAMGVSLDADEFKNGAK